MSTDIKYFGFPLSHYIYDMHNFLNYIFLPYFLHYPLLIDHTAHNHQIRLRKFHSLIPIKCYFINLLTYSLLFFLTFLNWGIIKAIEIEKFMHTIAHYFLNDFRIIFYYVAYKGRNISRKALRWFYIEEI